MKRFNKLCIVAYHWSISSLLRLKISVYLGVDLLLKNVKNKEKNHSLEWNSIKRVHLILNKNYSLNSNMEIQVSSVKYFIAISYRSEHKLSLIEAFLKAWTVILTKLYLDIWLARSFVKSFLTFINGSAWSSRQVNEHHTLIRI